MQQRDDDELATQTEPTPIGEAFGARVFEDDLLVSGAVLGSYVVEEALGAGGCGLVYVARHLATEQRVAIKVLRREMAAHPAMLTRFQREAEAIDRIGHPNIVKILELGELEPGRPFYVMELLEGHDLRRALHERGRFSPEEALDLLTPVCDAVQAAHAAGIVHRDIKASNVFIAEADGRRSVKLLDFGIAKAISGEGSGAGITEPGTMLGSIHNMAPEQVRGGIVDERTDIYALGVVIFQILTGEYPFHVGDARQLALLHLQAPVPRPSLIAPIPAALEAVVLRCLEKQPDKRFQSVAELLAALRAVVAQHASARVEVSTRAVGLYFEVKLTSHEDDDIEDEAGVEDMDKVLEIIERELLCQGFQLPLRASMTMLGVLLIEDAAAEQRLRDDTATLVDELVGLLEERPAPHPLLSVSISLTTGDVMCRVGEGGTKKAVGGPLLKVRNWAEQSRILTI